MKQMRVWVAAAAAVLMGLTSWLGEAAQPHILMAEQHRRGPLEGVLPSAFGEWRVDEAALNIELPPDVAAQVKAIYTQVADRVYVNGRGERIMLTLAYGKDQSDGFKVHRPEVCYAAQGFTVGKPADATLDLGDHRIDVKHVDTHLGERKEPVTYWMVIGNHVVNSPTRHKLEQIRYAMDGVIADGMLVRVSSLSDNPRAAYAAQAAFVKDWMNHVPTAERARLFGS